MTADSLVPCAWIYKRDGRLVPFEADKISQALFAATESLGRPDAFMARELTDSVLHFLVADSDGTIPTTTQVAEMVVKVVRELGQPALAQAFADHAQQRTHPQSADRPVPPSPSPEPTLSREPFGRWVEAVPPPLELAWRLARACLSDYALTSVFARDLAAAHRDGLLILGNLDVPLELAGCVVDPTSGRGGLVETIEEARSFAGSFLAIDGPEFALACRDGVPDSPASYVQELGIGLRAFGLRAIVNLNSATPPSWANDPAEGPLFLEQRRPAEPERVQALQEDLLAQLLASGQAIRVDWHLSERDWGPEGEARLLRLARRAVEGAALAFVFDRPRRPVHLAEGLDRRQPAALMTVGLDLCRLMEQAGLRTDPALFLHKLGSLARLALSAGAQKRDFLRRHSRGRPAVTRGFLLDRARLVVVPVGLGALIRDLLGQELCAGGPGLDFARQVLQRLREALRQDGQGRRLETCLDSATGFSLDEAQDAAPSVPCAPPPRIAGLTAWEPAAPPKHQLRAAGTLHAAAEMGTAAVLLPEEESLPAEQVLALLRQAWHHTEIVRLRFLRAAPVRKQLTAPWAAAEMS